MAILMACAVSANSNALARTGDVARENPVQNLDFTAAQIAAREHLDHFFRSVLDENGIGQKGSALRIAIPRADGRVELVWVTPFQKENGRYSGLPHDTALAATLGVLRFDRAQVVDWSFAGPDGRLYGNFATRLFLQTLPPEQAETIASLLSDTPAPEEWVR